MTKIKNLKEPQLLLFKILVNGSPCHGGEGKYPPIGEWTMQIKGNLECCERGYHLTTDPLRWWKPKSKLFLAETDGNPIGDDSDKACFAKIKLIFEITKDWKWLMMMPRVRCCVAASYRSFDAKADISWADLSWANLSRADLSRANLSGANLSWADLSWADLSKADLSWADLSGADLSRADLSWANLSWANLSRADLSWADLSGANLSGGYRSENPPAGYKINAEFRLEKLA